MSTEKHTPDFEDSLKRSLGRVQAPEGFADRVMARIEAEFARSAGTPVRVMASKPARVRRWFPAAIAAGLILSAGGWRYHEFRQGQRAKEQLLVALQITSSKLGLVENKIGQLNQRTIQ